MSETFKEFLKKKMFYGVEDVSGKEWIISHGGNPKAMESIMIIDLGEWAWQECYKYCAKEASPKMKLDFLKKVHPVLLEIAIACLGKRKIKLLLRY